MIASDVKLGKNVKIWYEELVNLYGCTIGDDTRVASFVEIGKGVEIGARCFIEAFAYIPEGVIIEDDVFVGPGVKFCNDKYPPSGKRWNTLVKKGAAIGVGAIIMCGITIGSNAKIGAGSLVLRNVNDNEVVIGNPAGGLVGSKWGETK